VAFELGRRVSDSTTCGGRIMRATSAQQWIENFGKPDERRGDINLWNELTYSALR
jgi:hypothetical protein